MKILNAVIVASAATAALVQADVTRAQSAVINTTHSNIRHPGEKATSGAMQEVSTTRGRVLSSKQKGKTGPANISDQASGGVLTKKKN
jgi:hypothetical protein